MTDLGSALTALTTILLPRPVVHGDVLICHIVSSDAFGNLLTDLTEERYTAWAVPSVIIDAGRRLLTGPVEAYCDVSDGETLALFSSSGRLEIAIRNGSAQKQLGLARGDVITLHGHGIIP